MFSASDYQAAKEPWQVELGQGRGRRWYTARLVSQDQVFQYFARLQEANRRGDELERKGGDEHAQATAALVRVTLVKRALRLLLRAAFPWRPWMLWRGDPVRRLLALDADTLEKALDDFFGFLARNSPERMREAILASRPSRS
jgi:hypothetical protein